MKPILTIAIPTYNRANRLKESMECLIEYCKGKNVEILVSDNASTDNTQEIVKDIQKKYCAIRYFRNEKNLGFDGNFLNCFEKANGEYVWLLGDDDIVLPGAIESVIDGCLKKPVCMHLNTSGIASENPLVIDKPRFKIDGYKIYKDKNDFIEAIGIYCTFVSSLVFNVDLVKKIRNKEKYFETNILQSHIFIECMNNEGDYIINTYNCVAARANETVGYDILLTWVKNYSELLLTTATNSGFDEEKMQKLLGQGLEGTVYDFIVHFRQTCSNEKDWDRQCIWPYINRYPELKKKYKKVLDCPVCELKWIELKNRVFRKFKSIYG